MSAEGAVLAGAAGQSRATCGVCPHRCTLSEGQRGICRARIARGGAVVSESYGRVTSIALDPIEKKPLARFMPGSKILSVGSYGCNMACAFCQNASIAQVGADGVRWREVSPEDLAALAVGARDQGNVGIAYTYNEPLVGYEYVRDCARLAHEAGLANVIVTNGMIEPGPLEELLPLVDAANVDLKAFAERFYHAQGGFLDAAKRTIEMLHAAGCHVEVTTLVVPGENDSEEEIDAASRWIASVGPSIPYHVTRFFPCNRMADRPPTPVGDVFRLAETARRHLDFVYVGNC